MSNIYGLPRDGCGEAQHHLAWYCEFGQYDYLVDKVAAERWYQKAFEQGHPETLYLFAIRQFKEGRPTETALELLRKASPASDFEANQFDIVGGDIKDVADTSGTSIAIACDA